MGEKVCTSDVVMYSSDYATSVPWGDNVLLDPHQYSSLSSGFLALDYVEIHFVAVEICIVGSAIC